MGNAVVKLVEAWIALVCGASMLYVSIMMLRNGYLYFEEPRITFLYADMVVAVSLIGCGLYLVGKAHRFRRR